MTSVTRFVGNSATTQVFAVGELIVVKIFVGDQKASYVCRDNGGMPTFALKALIAFAPLGCFWPETITHSNTCHLDKIPLELLPLT